MRRPTEICSIAQQLLQLLYLQLFKNETPQYVQKAKIDVLFLIDHRCSNRNLEFLRHNGEHYLNKDIRLINSEITLLKRLNGRYGPDTSYHATVGGCAILTFGSLAHITLPQLSQIPPVQTHLLEQNYNTTPHNLLSF